MDFQKHEKKIIYIFLFFCLIGFISLFWKYNRNIYGPVDKLIKENQDALRQDAAYAIRNPKPSDEELKNKDTDQDTLSDYDELNIYQTSPYLEDTDSDGIDDLEEIKSGSDPVCPKGKNCYGSDQIGNQENQNNLNLGNQENTEVVLSETGKAEQVYGKIFSGQASIEDIKELLITQGYTQEQVDAVDDEFLYEMYQGLIQQIDN